ncbi:riboflavin synthase [Pseudoalteromonas tunicata]|uniref:Riboflavin synthase n=1 Tax=Pseudoalteromonas tunicata D2 TaxID=87626 RepID=A4C9F2_9GAMM|nr:riboflavin synthase [Pseudoalteromonas tunicata]ATC93721.1 riboflavin synthase [Pseudoalteromonas tunicata]AXT29548.1 riboflavin synthase [Pseudoalteromonas tunicata]EAR29217.1 Riboflavin synthase subunit E [Pseudoalteromonas tunicata D2]MDP4982420.1 riboflavin synthase [Pseudoalteromonas tunicata]MDP5211926.1 riboflavin synthase [Pseudoalteromonas tunicata]
MFTGIIAAVGQISALKKIGGDLSVTVKTGKLDLSDVQLGDSIATNGVCLTVVRLLADGFMADVSQETLSLTGFAHYTVGQKVNLEKALMPTSRLGGHLVSGHIDGIATVVAMQANGRAVDYWLSAPTHLLKYIPYKGSVCIDGISLTVNELNASQFKLTIVPHTAIETTISHFKVGSTVNLEVDQLARYMERLLTLPGTHDQEKNNVSMDLLTQAGFI